MDFTGERLVPDRFNSTDQIMQEHINRYIFAISKIKELLYVYPFILDAPTGVGYGAALLAESLATTVFGYDNDVPSIEYARKRYESYNLQFDIFDLEKIEPNIIADVVVCFEGIEHVVDQSKVAKFLCDSLISEGLLFVSTPRRGGDGAGSPFHTKELNKEELIELFSPYLSNYIVYGQNLEVDDCDADNNARYYVLVGVK